MKSISVALDNHLKQEVTTLCTCWRVERLDGTVLGFTDFDQDLLFNGVLYESQHGYNRTAIVSDSSMAVANLEIDGILDSEKISENDLRNGLFDFANVFVFMLNWSDLTQGELKLRRGWFGEVTLTQNGMFHTELRGLAQALAHNFIEVYTPECRADFGDHRCKLVLSVFAQFGSVVSSANRRQFIATGVAESGGKPFLGGRITWTGGENTGKVIEIIGWNATSQTFTMFDGTPYPISPGDTFEVTPGCDKRFATCIAYGNAVNFRGEPHVPGQDEFLKYPDSKG